MLHTTSMQQKENSSDQRCIIGRFPTYCGSSPRVGRHDVIIIKHFLIKFRGGLLVRIRICRYWLNDHFMLQKDYLRGDLQCNLRRDKNSQTLPFKTINTKSTQTSKNTSNMAHNYKIQLIKNNTFRFYSCYSERYG